MQWGPGEIIDVDEKTAEQLLICNEIFDGHRMIKTQRAMRLEDAIEVESQVKDINQLTAGEAAQLGIKNVVDSSSAPEPEKSTRAKRK